jgi:amino acid permease
MSDRSDSDNSQPRHASSLARAAAGVRASVASAVSAVEERIEVGTISGTVLNTTCNVIGAGVLSLPQACYNASIGWTIILTTVVGFIGAFSAYVLFVGCDYTGAYFMNEVFARAIVGRPLREEMEEEHDGQAKVDPNDPIEIHERKKNFMRMILSMMIDGLICLNNYIMLAIYARIIIDSIPPVIVNFLGAHEDSFWASKLTWIVAASVIFFALTSVRNFDELKWSSILGVATIMWAALAVLIEYGKNGYQAPAPREIRWFGVYPEFASAIATLAVAYGYHYNAPSFYHELQNRSPKRMMKTVAISFPIIATTYIGVAVFGYLSFGHHVNDSSAGGVIINNYPNHNAVMNTVRLGLFFHFAAVYPVLSVCVRHSLHRFVLTLMGRRREAIRRDMPATVSRKVIVAEAFVIVVSSATLAYLDSNVGQLIIYIGAIAGASIMLTVPGVVGMCIWAPGSVGPESQRLLAAHPRGAPTSVAPNHMQRASEDDDTPLEPANLSHKKLLFGLSVGLTVIGYAVTMASFASAALTS